MDRKEQLKFCKICNNKGFNSVKGIICTLTNDIADFENSCPNFSENIKIKEAELAKMSQSNINMKLASKNKRFANYILDSIFFYVSLFIFFIFLGITVPSSIEIIDDKLMLYLIAYLLYLLYFWSTESLTQRSLAKYITKTKVINNLNEKPEAKTILIRSLCRIIPFEAFSFLGSESIGWHDSISKTYVVDAS